MVIEIEACPAPGWYALIEGHQFDLDDWCIRLKPPFDPAAIRLPSGRTLLRSTEFEGMKNAEAVRERANLVVSRMNGALRLTEGAHPVQVGGVAEVAQDGKCTTNLYAEAHSHARARAVADGEAIGPDGVPLPPPPPEKSEAQQWHDLAQSNEVASKLLDHFARADSWAEIYKTLEFCEKLVGGEHQLAKRLGDQMKSVKTLKSSANYYRHARTSEPAPTMTMEEATDLLSRTVRTALRVVMEKKV